MTRLRLPWIALSLLCLLPFLAAAQAVKAPAEAEKRPRIGLALSGGGARGFAHVGVLKVLEQMRIPVDYIAGTSAGSAIGAAYATGLSPGEIEAHLKRADWEKDMFDDNPPRRDQPYRRKSEDRSFQLGVTLGLRDGEVRTPPGLIAGQKVELFLHEMLGVSQDLESFDRLGIPFRAIATDLKTGELVVQERGSLVRAVRASMAVPSAFAPVREQGRMLVDGGLTRNLPVDIVRRMGADVVIAVNVGSPLLDEKELESLFGVAAQMVNILIERNVRQSLAEIGPDDVLIAPDLGKLSAADFAGGVKQIPAGEAAARAKEGELARLALPPGQYAAWRAGRTRLAAAAPAYDAVRYSHSGAVDTELLRAQSRIPEQGRLDRTELRAGFMDWMARGDVERIGYRLLDEPERTVLAIEVEEKSWGPNYLRFGLGAAADSESNSYFNLLAGYRMTWLNALGAEWKNELQFGRTMRFSSEFYQPLEQRGRYFVAPRADYENRPRDLFLGDDKVAEFGIRTLGISLDAGVQADLGEIRAGLTLGQRKSDTRTGSPLFPTEETRFTAFTGSFVVDQLDALDFPRHGGALAIRAKAAREVLGGEEDYNRVEAAATQVLSFGRHTLGGTLRLGYSPGSTLPGAELFGLGGFLNLSGYQNDQFLGSELHYGRLIYYNRVMNLPPPLGTGLYAGLSLETGRVGTSVTAGGDEPWRKGGSLFLGANTALGPLYLGYGVGEEGNRLLYLFLGRP